MPQTYNIDTAILDPIELEKVLSFTDYFGKTQNKFYTVSSDSAILYEYAPEIKEFIKRLYMANIMQPFNWVAWKDSIEARYLMSDPKHIKDADMAQLMKLLIVYLRSDQFIGGQLRESIESGFVHAILNRMNHLYSSVA